MIKMTVREAIGAYQAIEKLPRLPNGKIAYRLGFIGDKLEQHFRQFEKQRVKLVKEFSETDGDGRRTFTPANRELLDAKVEELGDVEIEINRDAVKLDEVLGPTEDKWPQIEPGLLRALQSIIIE